MKISMLTAASAVAILGAVLVAAPVPSLAADTAAQAATKACSKEYQDAKSAGKLGGKTWNQFLSECSARLKNTAAPPQKSSPKQGAAQPKTTPKNKSAAAVPPKPEHQSVQKICSNQYQAEKAAGTLKGKKWSDFLSECSAAIKNDKSDAAAIPPDPETTGSITKAAPATKPGGRPLSPGEAAFRQRIHECSAEWQHDKAAGTLPAGQKWPQFWSACNARLKTQG
ncbi:hypothetical protein KEU06_11380 [Pseudaminobacter sp. 19-2017]|uniref:Uncharacterized protein n=1 Tax=Pseudaminobacter soli (ex Zhang et al. 2022) TaxID=2831468 RepID=A0A942E1G6_9HYPH|nr:hypothetical protein [Pseudaminobacter soli]MBS3649210.1 hypothetical protein [Pseudaminobacter soli]